MREITAGDIGGTHARFCTAHIQAGRVHSLGPPTTLRTADFTSLTSCWRAYAGATGNTPPDAAAIALACPIGGDILHLTNNPWVIRPATLARELGIAQLTLVNDFGAVAHAVTQLAPAHLQHLIGPDEPLRTEGVTTLIGPGTGLGVAHLLRRAGRSYVIESEGGHMDFSPLDSLEDAILARLRLRYGRVSNERIASGPGLANLYEALAAIEGIAAVAHDHKSLWDLAIAGADPAQRDDTLRDQTLAATALQRFCLSLGSIAGDLALAHGANTVLIAGGILPRIAHLLPGSGFADRFTAKGRFARMMSDIQVKLITHDQPGLLGAAAAFAAAHPE